MDDATLDKLNDEVTKGRNSGKVYDEYVKPFVNEKRQILFQAFQDLPITAVSELAEVKRMMQTLSAFEQEFITFIETGQLANMAIAESMPKDGEKH